MLKEMEIKIAELTAERDEVEKTLTDKQCEDYMDVLREVVGGPTTFATAAQRAEAYLRVKGRWKE